MEAEKAAETRSPAATGEDTAKSPAATTAAAAAVSENSDEGLSIEDLALPRAVIARVSKSVLPTNAQIQKQALQAISKSATAFVNYISSHANENAARANKKTIRPEDVIEAAKELEFDAFVPQLQSALQSYNEAQSEKSKQRQKKAGQEGASIGAQQDRPATPAQATIESKGKARADSSPVTKRARRSLAEGEGRRVGISSDEDDNPDEENMISEDEGDVDDEDEGVDVSSEESEKDETALQEDPMEEKNNEEGDGDDEFLEEHEPD